MFLNVKKSLTATALITSTSTLLIGIASAGVMGIGGYFIMGQTLTTGELISFTLLLGFMVAPIVQMSNISTQLTEAFSGLDRTEELMNLPSEADDHERTIELTNLKGDLTFEDVSFSYEAGKEVLHNISFTAPAGSVVALVGSSGSGKSTLINDTLYAAVAHQLHRAHQEAAPCEAIEGIDYFDKVINVDQSPIGRTPRSNPATYTGLFTPIRELMAEMNVAKERGYGVGRFSFNTTGGRCEACQGDGVKKVEMHFLPDVYVPCDVCFGKRYNRETLEVQYKGKNIAQILDLTVEAAHEFFSTVPSIARKLKTLLDVGLSYIKLGQSATTLSGGEAQRVKLALELSKRDTGRTLYILDEPTTGLHFADIAMLLKVLQTLRDAGNTIVIIEHNLDVIKTADWIIDMGPEGGSGGGLLIAAGTPEEVAANEASHTGRYLKAVLEK